MRAAPLRTLAVLGVGLAALVAILYYASTVDGRPPALRGISLTQHLTADPEVALTTSSVEVDFSEPVEHAAAEAAFGISPPVSGSFSWSATTLTFTPVARLPLRTSFEVSIAPGIRDPAGNEMATAPPPFHFETVGNPTVVATDPAEADEEAALDALIRVDFSTLMDTASVAGALRLAPATEFRVRWSRERLTIVPAVPLEPNRGYTLTIGVGARDQAGTPLARPFSLSFRTVASRLSADAIVPADGVEGVAITSAIAVVFDRPLDPDSVRDDLLTITPVVAGSLNAVVAPGAAGLRDDGLRVLRFQPSAPLEPNTTYDVSVGPGLLAADGAGLPAGLAWSFTTGAPTATLSNQVVFLSDRAGIANLWGMNADGTNQRQLSAELSPITDYSIAPDGRSFVVGDGAVIVWQHADGSARRLLTDDGAVEYDAAYAPDGTAISYGRMDAARGGAGLWRRDADGSNPQPILLPDDGAGTPDPTAAPATPVALLRAPRLSPDGSALAFVDDAGRVGILDLLTDRLSAAPFVALSAPLWQPDGSGILVSGLAPGADTKPRAYLPGSPVPLLDPGSILLDAQQVAGLRVVRLGRGASSVVVAAFGSGAARPAVGGGGLLAYVRLAGDVTASGRLWVSADLGDAGDELLADPGAHAGSVAFAPEPDAMLIGRVAGPADDPVKYGGVWLVNLRTGLAEQLSVDGWLPRWLP